MFNFVESCKCQFEVKLQKANFMIICVFLVLGVHSSRSTIIRK